MGAFASKHRLLYAGAAAAAIALIGSVAIPRTLGYFDATTSNNGNSFTTGTLQMTNSISASGKVVGVATTAGMKPGDKACGQVTITNSGTLAATETLTEANQVNGAGSPTFGADLQLTVYEDGTYTAGTCSVSSPLDQTTTGSFNALASKTWKATGGATTTWASGESHTFTFVVSFPDSGSSSDNQYQGTTASADFTWTGKQA